MARISTKYIIWHHSASKPSMHVDAEVINRWHLRRGWNGIGYHRVILRDGTVEQGRADNAQGAHCAGFNHVSYGICLVGGLSDTREDARGAPATELNFTDAQYATLLVEAARASELFPDAAHIGHGQLKPTYCPGFDVQGYIAKSLPEVAKDVEPADVAEDIVKMLCDNGLIPAFYIDADELKDIRNLVRECIAARGN